MRAEGQTDWVSLKDTPRSYEGVWKNSGDEKNKGKQWKAEEKREKETYFMNWNE
jgi:hypothetical protein